MSNELFYVIMYSVIAIKIYTAVILLGLYKAYQKSKRNYDYLLELKSIIEEIKTIITKEEPKYMKDKGSYKSVRDSDMVSVDDIQQPQYFEDLQNKKVNSMSLADLLNRKATEEEYEEVLDLLTELIRKTYQDYKFMIAKGNKKTDGNFVQIISKYEEAPELHDLIFRKSVDYGINMRTLQEKFAQRVADGKVIDLGKDIIVILDDGEFALPTGISPINSGVEGGEISAIITFVHKDDYEEWAAHNLGEKKQ